MRSRTMAISIACHVAAGLGGALLVAHDPVPRSPAPPTTIELVDAPSALPTPASAEASTGGGARAGFADRSAARVVSRSRNRTRMARGEANSDDGDPRGALRFEARDGDVNVDAGDGEGNGRGAGIGGGHGRGIGLGDGARIADAQIALVLPPAPAASKARSAKLVYPVRERDADDAELFVARVTVDADGFVVGARLVRGFGGPRDALAADLIWKFRYAPALDDDGRPIRSMFDQRFLVGR